jgi:hypothetical protein
MSFISRLFGSRALPGTAKENDGFLDIDLPITSNVVDEAVARITCRGSIGGQVVGFGIQLRPKWEQQTVEGSNAEVFWGSGSLTAEGEESSNLIALMAVRYGLESFSEKPMLPEIAFQVVCLEGDPRQLPIGALRTKLFFFQDADKRYAEVYLNVDARRGVLQLNEKDNGYRVPLLRALTEN